MKAFIFRDEPSFRFFEHVKNKNPARLREMMMEARGNAINDPMENSTGDEQVWLELVPMLERFALDLWREGLGDAVDTFFGIEAGLVLDRINYRDVAQACYFGVDPLDPWDPEYQAKWRHLEIE